MLSNIRSVLQVALHQRQGSALGCQNNLQAVVVIEGWVHAWQALCGLPLRSNLDMNVAGHCNMPHKRLTLRSTSLLAKLATPTALQLQRAVLTMRFVAAWTIQGMVMHQRSEG